MVKVPYAKADMELQLQDSNNGLNPQVSGSRETKNWSSFSMELKHRNAKGRDKIDMHGNHQNPPCSIWELRECADGGEANEDEEQGNFETEIQSIPLRSLSLASHILWAATEQRAKFGGSLTLTWLLGWSMAELTGSSSKNRRVYCLWYCLG